MLVPPYEACYRIGPPVQQQWTRLPNSLAVNIRDVAGRMLDRRWSGDPPHPLRTIGPVRRRERYARLDVQPYRTEPPWRQISSRSPDTTAPQIDAASRSRPTVGHMTLCPVEHVFSECL